MIDGRSDEVRMEISRDTLVPEVPLPAILAEGVARLRLHHQSGSAAGRPGVLPYH